MGIWLVLACVVWLLPSPSWGQTTGPHRGYGQFNKLAVRNYVPCGGVNVVTGWINFTDPQCQQLSSSWLTDNSTLVKTTGPQRVSEKQVDAVEVPLSLAGSNVDVNVDLGNVFVLNAIGVDPTFLIPTGTGGNPQCSQDITFRLSTTSPRTVTWASTGTTGYKASGIPLPTILPALPLRTHLKFRYNCVTTSWELLASNQKTGAETSYTELLVKNFKPYVLAPAEFVGTGTMDTLFFNDTTNECALWQLTLPGDYAGSPLLRLWYTTPNDPNTSHSAAFDVYVDAVHPTEAVDEETYDVANQCDDPNIPGNTPDVLWNDVACPLVNNDNMVINLPIILSVCANGATRGTWVGDLGLINVRFEYAK